LGLLKKVGTPPSKKPLAVMTNTKNMIKIFLFSAILFACGSSQKIVSFKKQSSQTGFYESDINGKDFLVLGDESKTFKLKSTPTVSINQFKTLEIAQECYNDEICVDFQLNEEGKLEYSELTKRNIHKQIFQVIDGVIIAEITVMDEIRSGRGRFSIKEQYFDSLFVIK
jgi:preprotein translocase subunit SecD